MNDNTVNHRGEGHTEQPNEERSNMKNERRNLHSPDGQASPATSSGSSPTFYPAAHQAEFLRTLFSHPTDSLIELRFINRKRSQQVFYEDVEELLRALPALLTQYEGFNVYIGVCPRSERNGTKSSIKFVQCLWQDFDAKMFQGGKEEILQRLREFPFPATVTVDSGHGFHCYWVFKEAEPIQSQADIDRIEGFNRRLANLLGGDPVAVDLARVLRLAGTVNRKDQSQPVPVRIVELESSRRYNLSDFDWLPDTERERTLTNGKTNSPSRFNPALSKVIDDVKAKTDIVEIIGQRISLDSNYKANCPFHSDANPSFSVHPQGQYFHCFGCGAGGDMFAFLERYEKKPFIEVVSALAKQAGIAMPETSKVPPKGILTASFDGLVDVVEHQGEVAFLVKEGDELVILPQVQRGGDLYLPPPKGQIPWLLPRGEEVLKYYQADTDAALFDDLVAYHQGISELPSEDYYILLAAYDFHSYLTEAVQYSPMLWLFAVPERGKSRTGKGIILVAYRGIHVESLREAYLIRVPEYFQPTLFFDVV